MRIPVRRPRIAFFDMAGCEGCQLAILDREEIFLDLIELVEIVEFREAMSERSPGCDIAFVEGSIHREMDAVRLRGIRDRCRHLVALGACACHGNVQARANAWAPAENLLRVHDRKSVHRVQTDRRHWSLWAHTRVRSVPEVVRVDWTLPGCPVSSDEFLHLVKRLLAASHPSFRLQPVCVECKRNGYLCVHQRGETCLGQITRGGCGAVCIGGGYRCDGCRGLLPDANLAAHRQLLARCGLAQDLIDDRYRLFLSGQIPPSGEGQGNHE